MIGLVALKGAAVVEMGEQVQPLGLTLLFLRRQSLIGRRVGQGHDVPGRGLDRILQVLVGGAIAFVAVGQLNLGEEIAGEAGFTQGAYLAFLPIELRRFADRQLWPWAGADDDVASAPEAAAVVAGDHGCEGQSHRESHRNTPNSRTFCDPLRKFRDNVGHRSPHAPLSSRLTMLSGLTSLS